MIALKLIFNHESFRENQEAIVKMCLVNRDVFVLLPTGGGKSLCYQMSSILLRGVTFVITPLLSLLQDQVLMFL